MCMFVDAKLTKKFYDKHPEVKICYKYVTCKGYGPYFAHQYEPGWNYSNTRRTYPKIKNKIHKITVISHGIHVYLSRKRAVDNRRDTSDVVIPVQCHKKDLIAISDNGQAVYKKVFLKDTCEIFKKT